ncbi:MAG TPA: hypothetical protein VF057_13875 [Thermoanaerobaculia bacterium]
MRHVVALLMLSVPVAAQDAWEWMIRGDVYAERSQHADAAAAYREAIAADPALRERIAPRLARQLLWSDEARAAVPLFEESLLVHADDCDLRNDYGLALAWSDRLDEAMEQYRRVVGACPAARNTARLRAAMAARWADRPSLASAFYRAVLSDGTPRDQSEARAGLAYIDLIRDENRAAFAEFDRLGHHEGAAIAAARLGDYVEAERRIDRVEAEGALPRDLLDLREVIAAADLYEVRPASTAFRDADGTSFGATEVGVSRPWRQRGRGEIALGVSSLSNDDGRSHDAQWAEITAEQRFSTDFAARGAIRFTSYDDWRPLTGELRGIWTPSDAWRFDGTLARLQITDHVGAIDHRLTGTYAAASIDRRVGGRDVWTGGMDTTRWSEGNTRLRVIARWQRRFEGVPRVTLELPLLLQFYDEPFAFGLFSPERYVEVGPGVILYRRYRRVWNFSVYGRAGVQRENSDRWRALGVARAAIERDLRDLWALRASAAWSNSNVTGSGGFERTSLRIEVAKRF